MSKKRSLRRSFGFAIEGIFEAVRTEPNMKVHLFASVMAILTGLFLKISQVEWLAIFSVIALVFILELLNTAIEAVVDLASPKKHPKAKLAKDVSAGAVFVAALIAFITGVIVFLPKIIG